MTPTDPRAPAPAADTPAPAGEEAEAEAARRYQDLFAPDSTLVINRGPEKRKAFVAGAAWQRERQSAALTSSERAEVLSVLDDCLQAGYGSKAWAKRVFGLRARLRSPASSDGEFHAPLTTCAKCGKTAAAFVAGYREYERVTGTERAAIVEECAKVADSYVNNPIGSEINETPEAHENGMTYRTGASDCADVIAARIRALAAPADAGKGG